MSFDPSHPEPPSMIRLIPPCGGSMVDLLVPSDEQAAWHEYVERLPLVQLSERATCELELGCRDLSPA